MAGNTEYLRAIKNLLGGRFPALRGRDFRRLWLATTVSVAGSQMQFVALNWHIYQLAHSPIALGLIGLFRVVPIVAFSLFGGLVADAWDRRRVLFATQTFLAFISAALGFLTYTGQI